MLKLGNGRLDMRLKTGQAPRCTRSVPFHEGSELVDGPRGTVVDIMFQDDVFAAVTDRVVVVAEGAESDFDGSVSTVRGTV